MSLPSPLLSVPAISNAQASFNGLVIGPSTPFGAVKWEGLDKPEVRSGNTDRPRTRGAFVGLNLLKTRTPTLTLDIGPPFGAYASLPGALAALRTACATEGTTEYPLWIQLPGFPLVCCMARVLRKNVPYDITADIGHLVKGASIQFEATDPYLYAAPTVAPNVGLPVSGGFSFPLAFPLSFGGGSSPNQIALTNSGDVACWPVLVITGPCVNPSVANLSIAGGPTVNLGITLNAGDMLTVDCDLQTIMFTPAGQSVGAPFPQLLQAGSTFFSLAPGTTNLIAFNDQSTSPAAGTLTVWGTSAYDGLT